MSDLRQDLRHWMFDVALPFWGTVGVDRARGGYVEQLSLEGRPVDAPKRVRVICRQIYVFSHAGLLGWPEGEQIAEMGCRYLVEHAWLGPERGWARLLGRGGEVLDTTPDLYDLAFVLFALGWRLRASGDREALTWAHRTLDFIERELRHPLGGFLNSKPAAGLRQQNPHMHLLEASLVLLEASGDARFRALADELVDLFASRFYDRGTSTLAEYFEPDLTRCKGEVGRIVEPGHQFEWAWILASHERLTGARNRDLVQGLITFGEQYGIDPGTHATYNQVRDDGEPLDRGSRTWPNTERIKAAVARFDLFGDDPRPVLEQSGRLLLDRYLSHDPPGTWIDAFDEGGRPAVDKVPTSTLYHVFLAFAEALRALDSGAAAAPA